MINILDPEFMLFSIEYYFLAQTVQVFPRVFQFVAQFHVMFPMFRLTRSAATISNARAAAAAGQILDIKLHQTTAANA